MQAHVNRVKPTRFQRSLKNLIINPAYQMKYIFWIGASGLSLVSINTAVFYSYIKENYTLLVELSPMTDEAKTLLYQELTEIIIKLGGFSLAFILVISLLGIVLSHRTAGPMFHFKRVFNTIRDGKRDARIRLRPKDDFQDVANSFNEMMDAMTK